MSNPYSNDDLVSESESTADQEPLNYINDLYSKYFLGQQQNQRECTRVSQSARNKV